MQGSDTPEDLAVSGSAILGSFFNLLRVSFFFCETGWGK